MNDWLKSLTEDYLLAWSNRGQLRRAQKLLSQLGEGSVTLGQDSGHGEIDGHRQQLTGVGFEDLSCSCTATGTCHHLVCFLLALSEQARASLGTTNTHPSPDVPTTDTTPSVNIPTDTAPTDIPFWQHSDEAVLATLLGRAHMRRAHRLHAQGIGVDWEETRAELTATVELGDGARVRIPVTGLPGSVCSCKQTACVHRALTILACRHHHGLAAIDVAGTLDAYQNEIVNATMAWLGEVAGHGLAGFSDTQFARGRALATELQQSDLPRPGRSLNVWLAQLEGRNSTGRASVVDLGGMAELWMLLRGLNAVPLPRRFAELAGSHRRNYRLQARQSLLCLGPEMWRTATGFRGYSMHFLATHTSGDHKVGNDRTAFFSYSEARGLKQDPTWNCAQALRQASLGAHKLLKLPGHRFILNRAAFSDDGRIAARGQTAIDELAEVQAAAFLHRAEGTRTTIGRMLQLAEANPAASVTSGKALLRCRITEPPQYDAYRKQWVAIGTCLDDESVTIACRDTHQANLLAQHHRSLLAFFGYVTTEENGLSLTPIIGIMDQASPLALAGPNGSDDG
jgi:hypothetical protein